MYQLPENPPNVSTATLQQIFDYVTTFLVRQNAKAVNANGTCLYRFHTPDGQSLKCAAGCLIPDDKYDPDRMENVPCTQRDVYKIWKLDSSFDRRLDLIRTLQVIHDQKPVSQWHVFFAKIASHFDLIFT